MSRSFAWLALTGSLCLGGVGLALLPTPAAAEGNAPQAPAAPRPAARRPEVREEVKAARRAIREKLRQEVLDQMRTMRMWKLTDGLKLDQATAAKVFPILAEYDERGAAISRERGDIAREVNEQVQNGHNPDEARLRLLIDRLIANQARRTALEDERFRALRPALSPYQQARLLLLLPKIEDEFRHKIREAFRIQREAEEKADAAAATK